MACDARPLLASVALFVLASVAVASEVQKLTSSTFDGVISKEPLVLVKFFAPWCHHCQQMASDYEKAASELKGKAVLAEVDATADEALGEKYDITGFPTLKLFSQGQALIDYQGERDTESIVAFVERAILPAYDLIDSHAAFQEYLISHTTFDIVVGVGLDQDARESFKRSSMALRDAFPDQFTFVVAMDHTVVMGNLNLKGGEFALLRHVDGHIVASKYDLAQYATLDLFIKAAMLPVFGEFSQSTADLYTELPMSLVIGFFTGDKLKESPIMLVMNAVAEKKKDNGKVVFAWADGDKLDSFQEYVDLRNSTIPVCAYSFDTDQVFKLPSDISSLTESNLESWVDDLIAGRASPRMRSQPIPEKQSESGATDVVGDTWKQIVQDSTKDVLIAQVAPWCGHCNAMKPAYHRVANELKAAGVKNVVIAIMDATENDAPSDYVATGFPTIHFFPAGADFKGEVYDGDRSSKAIIDFLKEKSTNKFEFDTSKLGEDPTPETEDEMDEMQGEGDENMEDGEDGEDGEDNVKESDVAQGQGNAGSNKDEL